VAGLEKLARVFVLGCLSLPLSEGFVHLSAEFCRRPYEGLFLRGRHTGATSQKARAVLGVSRAWTADRCGHQGLEREMTTGHNDQLAAGDAVAKVMARLNVQNEADDAPHGQEVAGRRAQCRPGPLFRCGWKSIREAAAALRARQAA
jgi:hypothetical protein